MTLTLNLPPEMEERLLAKAAEVGVDVERCAELLLENELAAQSPSTMSEGELLLEASRGLPESVWMRYHELSRLRQQRGVLNGAEHFEFCKLNELIETTHARRMKHVAELALRRRVGLRELMDELGFPNYGRD